jgi:hypothetical protein
MITKRQKKDYDFKINQLKDELISNRHILACLGSVGLTFVSDINLFKDYLEKIGEFKLLQIIKNNRSLTPNELKEINKIWRNRK